MATFINAANDINNAAGALQIRDLAGALSPIDTSGIRSTLTSFYSQLDSLGSQFSVPIEAPTLQLYYAVPVSKRARDQAVTVRDDAQSTHVDFTRLNGQVDQLSTTFDQFGQGVRNARRQANNAARVIVDAMNSRPASPANYPILYPLLLDMLAVEGDLTHLTSDITSLSSRLTSTGSSLSSRLGELNDLTNNIDYALG